MSGYRTQTAFAWPDAAVATLRELRKKGMSCSYIAKHLSEEHGHAISRNAVIGKCDRSGIEGPSRVAVQAAAKVERARRSPPKFKTPKERTNTDAVRQRRAADLVRAAKAQASAEIVVLRVAEDPDLIAAAPCCIMDLTQASCRWPLNRTADHGEALFCANTKEEGRSYCEGHSRRAYTRTVSNEQRLAEKRQVERNRDAAYAAGLRDRVFGFGLSKRFA